MSHPDPLALQIMQPSNCEGCGLCCEGIGSPVLHYQSAYGSATGHPFRPEGLPESLIAEIDDFLGGLHRGQEPLQQCLWFDPEKRACRHYEWRPQICRDYELAGRACLECRQIYRDQPTPPKP